MNLVDSKFILNGDTWKGLTDDNHMDRETFKKVLKIYQLNTEGNCKILAFAGHKDNKIWKFWVYTEDVKDLLEPYIEKQRMDKLVNLMIKHD